MKRTLTEKEKNWVIRDLGKDFRLVSPIIQLKMIQKHKDMVKAQLDSIEIYPEILPDLKKEIHKSFYESIVSPGENVGVLCAQSIGEKQTQSTLNSFHAAGIAVQMVLTGVPRFMDILNATKDPKVSTSRLYLKNKNLSSPKEIRNAIASSIVFMDIKTLMTSFTFFTTSKKQDEVWYYPYSLLFGNDFRELEFGLSIYLDKKLLYQYKLSMFWIKEKLERMFNDIRVVVSPVHLGQIDIFVDVSEIDPPEENTLFLNQDNYIQVYIEEVVLEKLKEVQLSGISGISEYYIQKDTQKDWYIETVGNNFKELLGHTLFEVERTISNNMWDIYECLGIEAARQFLFEELWNLVTSDGSFINPCHVLLLVDIMTHHGNIISVSRYGIKKEQTGVLSRASFEESTDHFLNAAFFSELEPIKGVSASIICGKRSKMGTGLCDLIMDLKALEKK
jgi:DNA-directed RNA polymerase II subunit RPB1